MLLPEQRLQEDALLPEAASGDVSGCKCTKGAFKAHSALLLLFAAG